MTGKEFDFEFSEVVMKTRRIAAILGVVVLVGTALVVSQVLHAGPPPKDATYVGAKKCKACHMKMYKKWEKMKHATNWDTLKPEHYTMKCDVTGKPCLACHTTGYGEPSGFKSVDETPKLKSVGCESCHGPGSAHLKFVKDKDNKKKLKAKDADAIKELKKGIDVNPGDRCIYCHNPHISYKKWGK